MKLIAAVFLMCLYTLCFSQNQLTFLNGKTIQGKLLTEKEDYFGFRSEKKEGKTKLLQLSKYRLFSYTNEKGEETILYQQDSSVGNYFSQTQMKLFVFGQRDAYQSFRAVHYFVGGLALGYTSVLLDTYEFQDGNTCAKGFFHRTPSIAPIAVPLVFTIGAGFMRSKVRREHASDASFLSSEHYIDGFRKVAKFKRLKNAFLGSVAGVAAGFITYQLAHKCP